MKRPSLKAEKRKVFGRKVKTLREKGEVPSNIYGKGVKSQAVKVDESEFKKVFREVGETGLVDLRLGSKANPVLIHNVQTDPVTDEPLHADFFQVNLKEKVNAQVPIELLGEAPAEKEGLGTVVQYINEVDVEALPTDLPENFQVDLGELVEANQTICVKDLTIDKKKVDVENEPEQIIAKVEPPREEEEEPVPVAEEGEETEAEKEEGEIKEEEEEEVKKAGGEEKEPEKEKEES